MCREMDQIYNDGIEEGKKETFFGGDGNVLSGKLNDAPIVTLF